MKLAVYIEGDYKQIILTPENDEEKNILSVFEEKADEIRTATITTGSFYHCQGGWVREGSSKESVMLILRRKE